LADEPYTGKNTARGLSIETQIGRHFKARSQNQKKEKKTFFSIVMSVDPHGTTRLVLDGYP
jgi:hypothetical protein